MTTKIIPLTSITTQVTICVRVCLGGGTFKIYALSYFQIYNMLLLTMVTMLDTPSPGVIYLVTRSL